MNTDIYENTDIDEAPVAETPVAETPVAEAPVAEAPTLARETLIQEYEILTAKLTAARAEWVAAGRAAEQAARERLGADELEAAHEELWTKMYALRVGELGAHAAAVEAVRERLREARESLNAITIANSMAKTSLAKSRAICLRVKQAAKQAPEDETLKAEWKSLAASLSKEEKSRKDIRKVLKATKITCENLSSEYRSMKEPAHVRPATLVEKA